MELLIVFVLGIIAYNFVFQILESISNWIAFKFVYLRGKDELKIKEMEMDLFSDEAISNPIGFDMNPYPSEEELCEEEDDEEWDDVDGKKQKIGYKQRS